MEFYLLHKPKGRLVFNLKTETKEACIDRGLIWEIIDPSLKLIELCIVILVHSESCFFFCRSAAPALVDIKGKNKDKIPNEKDLFCQFAVTSMEEFRETELLRHASWQDRTQLAGKSSFLFPFMVLPTCGRHLPLIQMVWAGSGSCVGVHLYLLQQR